MRTIIPSRVQKEKEDTPNFNESLTLNEDYLIDDPMVVGYMDQDQQNSIYHMILSDKIIFNEGAHISVLDIGCGRSDVFGYLARDLSARVRYVGVDNNQVMLNTAVKKYPELNGTNDHYKLLSDNWFSLLDENNTFYNNGDHEVFDWTVCIGSLNIDYNGMPNGIWDRLLKTIQIGLEYSTIGTSIAILHSDPTGNYNSYPIPMTIDKIMEFFPNNRFEISYKDMEFIYKINVFKKAW